MRRAAATRLASRSLAALLAPVALLAFGVAASHAEASAPAAPTAAPAPATASAPVAVRARLSNLHTESRWAYPTTEAIVRSEPTRSAHTIGRLRLLTVDEQAELYLALAAEELPSGEEWVQIELPGRPNGRLGWVPRTALGPFHSVDSYLHVDQRTLRATLYRKGRAIFTAPVGVGKPSTKTPTGHFYVLEKLITLDAPLYGPYALGTSAYAPTLAEWPGGGVVGIHGTNEPALVPGHPSHGCMRMHDADIARLWHMIAVGTPIEITD